MLQQFAALKTRKQFRN